MNTEQKEYTWFVDPGHAWLEVEISELYRLGIADNISCYSYMQGEIAYLEEDCDAQLFISKIGYLPKTEIYHEISPVRRYQSYSYCKNV